MLTAPLCPTMRVVESSSASLCAIKVRYVKWEATKRFGSKHMIFDGQCVQDSAADRCIPRPDLPLFKAALQGIGEAIVITSPQLDQPGPVIEYVNPAFTRMTGYSAEEVIGKTPRILQGPLTDRAVLSR